MLWRWMGCCGSPLHKDLSAGSRLVHLILHRCSARLSTTPWAMVAGHPRRGGRWIDVFAIYDFLVQTDGRKFVVPVRRWWRHALFCCCSCLLPRLPRHASRSFNDDDGFRSSQVLLSLRSSCSSSPINLDGLSNHTVPYCQKFLTCLFDAHLQAAVWHHSFAMPILCTST